MDIKEKLSLSLRKTGELFLTNGVQCKVGIHDIDNPAGTVTVMVIDGLWKLKSIQGKGITETHIMNDSRNFLAINLSLISDFVPHK